MSTQHAPGSEPSAPSGQGEHIVEVLSSGKELSRIHAYWLGPQGFTLPFPIPYVGAGAAGLALVLAIPLLGVIGVGGVWHYAAAVVIALIAGYLVAKNTSSDRPMWVLLATIVRETSAPRPAAREGERAVLRPWMLPVREAPGGPWYPSTEEAGPDVP